MSGMIKTAVVTPDTPSVQSGKKRTVERDGESVCVDELEHEELDTVKRLSKKASFEQAARTQEKTV